MSGFLVGARLLLTVTVTDKASGALVDPAAIDFKLLPPSDSPYALGDYAWNGTVWTSSESIIAVPAKGTVGIFTLRITIPYANNAKGDWTAGWKSTANGGGFGEGSGDLAFYVKPTGALPP